MNTEIVNRFLEDFTAWVSQRPDVIALALVGSHARNAARETSDIDLVLITRDPYPYLQYQNWLCEFGRVEKQQVEDYGPLTSIRVWYQNGLEVEYGITSERWAAEPLDEGTRRVISDGMRVLFERGDILSRHLK